MKGIPNGPQQRRGGNCSGQSKTSMECWYFSERAGDLINSKTVVLHCQGLKSPFPVGLRHESFDKPKMAVLARFEKLFFLCSLAGRRKSLVCAWNSISESCECHSARSDLPPPATLLPQIQMGPLIRHQFPRPHLYR